MYHDLTAHARRELALAGHTRRHPGHAILLTCLVAAFDSADHPDGPHTAADQLHTLLTWGTLTPLTSDPGEWADKTDQAAGRLWRSTRNPQAFSADGGATYWLLTDPSPDGVRTIHTCAPPRLEGAAEL